MIAIRRLGNIFNEIIDKDNLDYAIDTVCFMKVPKYLYMNKELFNQVQSISYDKVKEQAKEILDNKEYYIHDLYNILVSGYSVSEYTHRQIHEGGKDRDISVLPLYPDRIVQHAVLQVLELYWDSLLIDQSCACRVGKGIKAGVKYTIKYLKDYNYCLKCDIHHFYPTINHDILKSIIRQKLKDENVLEIVDALIDSSPGKIDVPIGNYISQWFGNLYLDPLDRLIKEKFHIKGYVRYCDDFIIFSNDKKELNFYKKVIQKYLLYELGLTFSKADIFPVNKRYIDFLGYVYEKDEYDHIITRIRHTTFIRALNAIRKLPFLVASKIVSVDYARSVLGSYGGLAKLASGHNLYNNILEIDEIRRRIDEYGRIPEGIEFERGLSLYQRSFL